MSRRGTCDRNESRIGTWSGLRVSPVLPAKALRHRGAREGKKRQAMAAGGRGGAAGGSCRLTNYTRSTRFTGDALSETIVHPRSLLYLFTPPLGPRLCPLVNRPSPSGSSASPFVSQRTAREGQKDAAARERKGARGR